MHRQRKQCYNSSASYWQWDVWCLAVKGDERLRYSVETERERKKIYIYICAKTKGPMCTPNTHMRKTQISVVSFKI